MQDITKHGVLYIQQNITKTFKTMGYFCSPQLETPYVMKRSLEGENVNYGMQVII